MNDLEGGEIMDEMLKHGIPAEAIAKGRAYVDVLCEYKRIWDGVKAVATVPGKTDDEIFADTMAVTAYRIYLLGVEDGMKGAAQ